MSSSTCSMERWPSSTRSVKAELQRLTAVSEAVRSFQRTAGEKKQKKTPLSKTFFFFQKSFLLHFYNIWHSTNSWCFYKINL